MHDRVRLMAALLELPGVGPVTALAAMSRMRQQTLDPDALADELKAIGKGMKRPIKATVSGLELAFSAADRVMNRCRTLGIEIAIADSGIFWKDVWSIPKPPAMLFFKGKSTAALAQRAIAVVGTRQPSDFGAGCAHRIASEAVKRGLTVVSGLAVGCDRQGHIGALEANGLTIAVLAHGLDSVYPATNQSLADSIIENGGMLVSEYAPGIVIRSNQLVARDRLQSALSRGLVVIETDVKGGTMHTVHCAKEQKRLIACVNHGERFRDLPKSRGNQALIADGSAVPIGDRAQLLAYFDLIEERNQLSSPARSTPNGIGKQGLLFDEPGE